MRVEPTGLLENLCRSIRGMESRRGLYVICDTPPEDRVLGAIDAIFGRTTVLHTKPANAKLDPDYYRIQHSPRPHRSKRA